MGKLNDALNSRELTTSRVLVLMLIASVILTFVLVPAVSFVGAKISEVGSLARQVLVEKPSATGLIKTDANIGVITTKPTYERNPKTGKIDAMTFEWKDADDKVNHFRAKPWGGNIPIGTWTKFEFTQEELPRILEFSPSEKPKDDKLKGN